MSIADMLAGNTRRVEEAIQEKSVRLEICRVDNVNEKAMTVDVYNVRLSKMVRDVKFSSPLSGVDIGLISIPTKNSMAIVATTNGDEMFIVSFLSNLSQEGIGESLRQGETLLQSIGYSFLKLGDRGDVMLSSGSADLLHMVDGKMIENTGTKTSTTLAQKVTSGKVGGMILHKEEYFSKEASGGTIEEIMYNVGKGIPVTPPTPTPVVEIIKGPAPGDPNSRVRVKVNNFTFGIDNNGDVRMYKGSKANAFKISVSESGHVTLSGKSITLNFDSQEGFCREHVCTSTNNR